MDIVEQLRKSANTIYSQDGYTFRLGLHNEAADEIERLRGALKEIADAKISGVVGDGYNVRDWLIKHHVMLVDKARAALKEGE